MRLACTLAFLTVAAAIAVPARADVSADAQKEIKAAYHLSCAAVLNPTDANIDAAFTPLAPTFVNISADGLTIKRSDFVAQVRSQLKLFRASKCDAAVDSMTQSDPNTIVVALTTTIEGTVQSSGGDQPLSVTAKTQDTWSLTNGTWLETQSKDLPVPTGNASPKPNKGGSFPKRTQRLLGRWGPTGRVGQSI